jgi:hypothetical protein
VFDNIVIQRVLKDLQNVFDHSTAIFTLLTPFIVKLHSLEEKWGLEFFKK